MFHNQNTIGVQRCQGAMLVMAIFILIVISLLMSSMTRLFQNASQGVIYEVQGLRANLAANAGVERQLYRAVRQNESCATLDNDLLTLANIPSLANCQIALACVVLSVPGDAQANAAVYVNLQAVADCQGGDFAVQRAIETQFRK